MAAFKHGPGCSCCGGVSTCVTVIGCCSLPLENATVTLKRGGSTIDSGVTNASGVWCSTLAATGDTFTIAGPIGWHYTTRTGLAITLGGSRSYTLSPEAGYICGCANKPLPATLTLNDGIGDIAVTYDASSFYGAGWVGCATRDAPVGCTTNRLCEGLSGDPKSVTVGVHVGFSFGCLAANGSMSWVVTLFFPLTHLNRLDVQTTCAEFHADFAAELPVNSPGTACRWDYWNVSSLQMIDTTPSCDPLLLQNTVLMRVTCWVAAVLNNGYGIWPASTTWTLTE